VRLPSRHVVLLALVACAPEPAGDDPGHTDATADSDVPGDADHDGVPAPADCDDADPGVHPGAVELPSDGVDQDCDGIEVCRVDLDGDGAAGGTVPQHAEEGCHALGLVSRGAPDDCDDFDPARWSGAPEIDGSGVDEDCDGVERCYVDADGDGARSTRTVIDPGDGTCRSAGEATLAAAVDCDDADPLVGAGNPEVTGNDVDEDCDGTVRCWSDADGDGARSTVAVLVTGTSCVGPALAPAGAPEVCDDVNWARHPGATEVLGDGVDQDCDGKETCYRDDDQDGIRGALTVGVSLPNTCQGPGLARPSSAVDCDDHDIRRFPGAVDVIADGVDADCDGLETCYVDGDRDGARSTQTVTRAGSTCSAADESLARDPLDCDDTNRLVRPSTSEKPDNTVDENCDGVIECWVDADGDGWRASRGVPSADGDCDDPPEVPVTLPGGDCADADPARNPGAYDVPVDGIDQDCRGGDACLPGLSTCPAASCEAVHRAGLPSGTAWLELDWDTDYATRCEQDLDGGGWTLAAVVADDPVTQWTWTTGWSRSTEVFGSLASLGHDLRVESFFGLGVRDLLFVHVPSGIWAAYHDVGDGTLALDELLWSLPSSECAAPTFPLSAGTLAVDADLCSTDLFLNPAGWDGGQCDHAVAAYGPAWSTGLGGACPLYQPGSSGSLGPDHLHPADESDAVGFARALGLVDATGHAGSMQVYVR
jgi:hypothetical protein